MSLPAIQRRYTPDQYLVLERAADYKSEYINGQIYAMAGASRAHNLIAFNVGGEIRSQLKGRSCEGYGSDMRVKVAPTGLYTYPDISVACGEIQFDDAQKDTLLNPTVLIEVLSPSTEAYDRGEKFAHYRRLPSLLEYLLIAQDRHRVEQFVRQGEQWLLTEFNDLQSIVQVASIGCHISLTDLYEKVLLPEQAM